MTTKIRKKSGIPDQIVDSSSGDLAQFSGNVQN